MSVDLASVDPAVVSTQAKAAPKAAAPTFPPPTGVIIRDDPEALDSFNAETHVAVKCTDDCVVFLPKESALNIPFIADQAKADPKNVTVKFRGSVVVAINHWIEKKGVDGKPSVAFARPILHTDICMLLEDEWEKNFVRTVLLTTVENCTLVLNAAEKTGLTQLQEFALVSLSCALRGKTEGELMHALGRIENFGDEDLEAVDRAYPWFKEVTAAH